MLHASAESNRELCMMKSKLLRVLLFTVTKLWLPIRLLTRLLFRWFVNYVGPRELTARILCQSFMPKRHRQLRIKDLPKVPMWRLERDSSIHTYIRIYTKIYFEIGFAKLRDFVGLEVFLSKCLCPPKNWGFRDVWVWRTLGVSRDMWQNLLKGTTPKLCLHQLLIIFYAYRVLHFMSSRVINICLQRPMTYRQVTIPSY